MNDINFEWDEKKNELNKQNHKISFEEAQTVFYDMDALVIDCHCYRESDSIIRIILARKAATNESKYYHKF